MTSAPSGSCSYHITFPFTPGKKKKTYTEFPDTYGQISTRTTQPPQTPIPGPLPLPPAHRMNGPLMTRKNKHPSPLVLRHPLPQGDRLIIGRRRKVVARG